MPAQSNLAPTPADAITRAAAHALTQVAVGIVHNAQGQMLFAQRPAGKPYAGWWEFPGGKLEAGETVAFALARELKEELGITIHDCHVWLHQSYVYPHAHVNLQFCHVHQFSGQPQSLEGQAFAWGDVAAPPLPFLPAALPLLKVLQLPQMIRISAVAAMGLARWAATLQRLDDATLILSEPLLSEADALQALNACLDWKAQAPGARRVLLGSCHLAAWRGLCDGVHLSEADVLAMLERPSLNWVSAHASSPAALAAAKALQCDFVIASAPRINAPSGKQQPSWAELGQLLEGCQLAAFAAGQLGEHDLPFACAAGACGVVIEAW